MDQDLEIPRRHEKSSGMRLLIQIDDTCTGTCLGCSSTQVCHPSSKKLLAQEWGMAFSAGILGDVGIHIFKILSVRLDKKKGCVSITVVNFLIPFVLSGTSVGVCSLQSVQIVPYLVARSLLRRESTAARIHIYIMIMVASSCQSVYICTRTFAKGANTLGT